MYVERIDQIDKDKKNSIRVQRQIKKEKKIGRIER